MANTSATDHTMALTAAGHSNKNILKQTGMSLKTLYNVMKTYREAESTSTKPIPDINRSVYTKKTCSYLSPKVIQNLTPDRAQDSKGPSIVKKNYRQNLPNMVCA